jgi:hypothetical protein
MGSIPSPDYKTDGCSYLISEKNRFANGIWICDSAKEIDTRAALGSPPIVKKKSSSRNFKFQVMEIYMYLPNLRIFLAPNSSA